MATKFTQIACASKNLYALDEEGRVWCYVPAEKSTASLAKPRYAFWAQLTAHRAERRQP